MVVVQSGPDGYSAFHPAPLPPDPPVQIGASMQSALDDANQALGRLDGITMLLPILTSSLCQQEPKTEPLLGIEK